MVLKRLCLMIIAAALTTALVGGALRMLDAREKAQPTAYEAN
jgi:hypothetical protein